MKPAVSVSLVISTFNQPRVLAKVLNSLQFQTCPPEEILISDDGSDDITRELVKKFAASSPVPVKYIWHPHDGFRKTTILNKTVLAASGNYLVFTDGDCVPHPKFVADHAALAEAGCWVQGRRCFVREKFVAEFEPGKTPAWRWMLTGKITGAAKGVRWPISIIRRDTNQRGIIGCNMAFWREDILAVNGFDEDYTGWGTGEDSDIGTRLYHLGRRRKFVYGRAITFHLNHPAVSREHHAASLARLAETIASRKIRCEHGLDQRRWTDAKTSRHQNNLITSNNLDTMGGTFALALIINTFDQPDYLNRVLRAVSQQSVLPDEVLLADDGSAKETKVVFDQWRAAQKFRCEHAWQEHRGFRRTHILNQAIALAHGDYLVFLDGDTIPHPCFIADHRALAHQSQFVQGHRALIERKAAAEFGLHEFERDRLDTLCRFQLRGLKHAYRWPWPLRRVRQDLRGVRGCNLAIWRSNLARVNGYNEAFIGWGSEDLELALRLMNSGVRRLDVRGWALCYHLWHPSVSRDELTVNNELLAKAIREKSVRCELGLDRHLTAV